MEAAALARAEEQGPYGSIVLKKVYIYGGLDLGPIELPRSFGMAWEVAGWLAGPLLLQRIGPEAAQRLKTRIVAELKTTFASHYTAEISLADLLKPEVMAAYSRKTTGGKYLVRPHGDARQ
jgi:hypothetical protein